MSAPTLLDSFNISNYLAHEYNEYVNKLYQLALTDPKRYIEIKNNATRAVKTNATKMLFNQISGNLSKGVSLDANGNQSNNSIFGPNSNQIGQPNYPQDKILEFSSSVAITMDEVFNKLLKILFPDNIEDILKLKLAQSGASS